MDIKPIATEYKGYKFRSRLEARWAVFFDAIGANWKYEAEGFDLGGIWYLPDFQIESDRYITYIEIKPSIPDADEIEKDIKLAYGKQNVVAMLIGDPFDNFHNITKSFVFTPDGDFHHANTLEKMVLVGAIRIHHYLEITQKYFPVPDEKISDFSKYVYSMPEFINCLKASDKSRHARFEHGETPHA